LVDNKVLINIIFIVFLQGGSAVGRGNFLEIGPLDANLKQRNSTWLQKADLIFVVSELFLHHIPFKVICVGSNEYVGMQDLPVGVGYSYTEDPSVIATTDSQVAADAIELVSALTKKIPTLQSSPLFLVGESYGGKLAAIIGISMSRAIHSGILQLTLGGVVLGDSWISPDNFAVRKSCLVSWSLLMDKSVPFFLAKNCSHPVLWFHAVLVCAVAAQHVKVN
jgi:serine carboxypeptidase 1